MVWLVLQLFGTVAVYVTILGVRLFFIEGRVNSQEVRNFAKSQATNVIVLNKESHEILF